MDEIAQLIEAGLAHHRAGRLAEAERAYHQALARQPNHAGATHLIGVLAHQAGRNDLAVELIRRAIQLLPGVSDFHNNLGNALQSMGRVEEAAREFDRVLRLQPGSAWGHFNFANALRELKQFDRAVAEYEAAIRIDPNDPNVHYNLGITQEAQCKTDLAEQSYRRAIALRPDFAAGVHNLGVLCQARGRIDEAEELFRRQVALQPQAPWAYYNLGTALQLLERHAEAAAAFERALALKPDMAAALNNLGTSCLKLNRFAEAERRFRAAIELQPDCAEMHNNLGLILRRCGRVEQSVECFSRALALQPDYPNAHDALLFSLSYVDGGDPRDIFKEHVEWARMRAEPLGAEAKPFRNDLAPDRRLRIGYVSAELRRHAVASFLEPILRRHDHGQFEIFAYSGVRNADDVTQRLRSMCDHWRDIREIPDDRAAEMIREDQIDILVDLSGHTIENRLAVFARKPAPVQVSYLGYFNTTGMTSIAHRITDAIADPLETADAFYTEELIRLPRGAWCYQPPADEAALHERTSSSITFGSFNQLAKLTQSTIALWSAALRAVPSAKLLIKAAEFSDPAIRQDVLQRFNDERIEPARIELIGWSADHAAHLSEYQRVDIAIDPYPYHGTTTTCDALWMGVPVITRAGTTHVSRVGASLLRSIGLQELVAESTEDFVRIAKDLAGDLPRLHQLQRELRKRMSESPLMDEVGFTREMETGYRQMWQSWCGASGE